jgi:hypothetical protein
MSPSLKFLQSWGIKGAEKILINALLIITVDNLYEKGYIPHEKGLSSYLAS